MASQNADLQANAIALPAVKSKVNRLNGRIRIFESTVTITAPAPIVGENIQWGALPIGARVLGHLGKLYWSAGAGGSTINLGDAANPTRHLAATSVAAIGSAVPEAQSLSGAQFEALDSSNSATNTCNLVSVVAGAALLVGQVITLKMPYVTD